MPQCIKPSIPRSWTSGIHRGLSTNDPQLPQGKWPEMGVSGTWMEHYPLGEVMRIAAGGDGIPKTGQREAQRELDLRGVRATSGVQLELGEEKPYHPDDDANLYTEEWDWQSFDEWQSKGAA